MLKSRHLAAAGSGLSVTSAGVAAPGDDAARNSVYLECQEWAYDLRVREQNAHHEFEEACRALLASPVADRLRGLFVPKSVVGAVPLGISRFRNIAMGARGAALASAKAEFRLYQGIGVDGRAGAMIREPKSVLEGVIARGKLANWYPAPGAVGSAGEKISTVISRAEPALKWAGRAGTAVTAGISFYDQYQKDSRNPSMGEGERIARASVKGGLVASGAYFGAKGGALLGASIGAIGGPIGVAAGGIIGGIVGGIAGSSAGQLIGDSINSKISEFWH